MHSLSRHQQSAYQPQYANLPMQQHLPDVTEYSSVRMPRHDDFRFVHHIRFCIKYTYHTFFLDSKVVCLLSYVI
jgi:hypothetical protein